MPSSTSGAELGARLPEHDDDHAGEGGDRTGDRARPDLLVEEDGGEEQRDQRRDEGQRDRLGERHAAMPQKNRNAMTVTTTPRATCTRSVLRLGHAGRRGR